jgi:hypothetical protein
MIHDELNTGKWRTNQQLADACGCGIRTIAREIKHERKFTKRFQFPSD